MTAPRIAYSPAEAAQAIGCTRQHIYTLLKSGALPSVRIGRLRRIPAAALVRLVNGEEGGPT